MGEDFVAASCHFPLFNIQYNRVLTSSFSFPFNEAYNFPLIAEH